MEEARRVAHTLKGMAGTLGATNLTAEAHKMERAIRDGAEPKVLVALLAHLHITLSILLRRIARETGGSTPAIPASAAVPAPELDARLGQLIALLDADDMGAAALWRELSPAIEGLAGADSCREIGVLIEGFDFAAALPQLRQLAGRA